MVPDDMSRSRGSNPKAEGIGIPMSMNDVLVDMDSIDGITNEDQAREYFENLRWPDGPVCPFCGSNIYCEITPNRKSRIRQGLYKCGICKKKYTVTIGTIMHQTHFPLLIWVKALYLIGVKNISALSLQKQLGIGSYHTAYNLRKTIKKSILEVNYNPVSIEDEVIKELEKMVKEGAAEKIKTDTGYAYRAIQ